MEAVHGACDSPSCGTLGLYLFITTTCIAVIPSMKCGNLANFALLAKNDAILSQAQESEAASKLEVLPPTRNHGLPAQHLFDLCLQSSLSGWFAVNDKRLLWGLLEVS